MPIEITPIVTHRQIHQAIIDVDGERLIIDHSEGTTPDGTYQPHRQLTDTIEGEVFATLCNTPITVKGPHHTYDTTVYALLRELLYAAIPA